MTQFLYHLKPRYEEVKSLTSISNETIPYVFLQKLPLPSKGQIRSGFQHIPLPPKRTPNSDFCANTKMVGNLNGMKNISNLAISMKASWCCMK